MKKAENEKSLKNAEDFVQLYLCKKDQEKKLWSDLPQELLDLVVKHLRDTESRITFRSICRSWRSSPPIYRPLPFPTLLDSPCLLTLGGGKCRIYHPLYNGPYQMDIPALLGVRIRYSKYGWLLLSSDKGDDRSVFFFHPFNMTKIELPCLPFPIETMTFSTPPTGEDCFVIGIPFLAREFCIIRRGEESWRIFPFTVMIPDNIQLLSNCNPILYEGMCYCLCQVPVVAVFDPNEHRWRITYPIRFPKALLYKLVHNYLVEGNGKLFAVFEVKDYEPCIHVFSLNLDTMKWDAVKNLGNQMLYVSLGSSFSELAVKRGMRNKIYLPNVQDNKCVIYSLKTNECRSFFSNYFTRISTHGKEHYNCTWIKPALATLDEDLKW
ncbi:hypothetical protein RGQ29_025982 [Quercus rubra]|uniref:F-box domain-containing protein n=1 Tax=Quercus rubra TaxID=3512 RepID=A0AAN7EZC2_QUERU|nr:hypothetical protein RGQ29_025982 [Quercus rubra]